MCYNWNCSVEQNTRALCFSKAATFSQSDIVGRAPFVCRTNVLAVRLSIGSAHEGRFVMPKRKVPPDRILIDLYNSGLSCEEIAELYDTTRSTVAQHLRRLGISRTNSETWNLPGRHPAPIERDWLYQKYIVEELGMPEIGKILGKDPKTILYWMRKYDIPTRARGHNTEYLRKGQPKGYRHSPETIEKIRQDTIAKGKVPYLKNGEHWLKGKRGAAVPNWKGGITPERQKVYNTKKWGKVANKVWQRDNAICQRCSLDYRAVDRSEIQFHVHHIVSFADKKLRFELNNLVLLCSDCHYWVHGKENTEGLFLADE